MYYNLSLVYLRDTFLLKMLSYVRHHPENWFSLLITSQELTSQSLALGLTGSVVPFSRTINFRDICIVNKFPGPLLL